MPLPGVIGWRSSVPGAVRGVWWVQLRILHVITSLNHGGAEGVVLSLVRVAEAAGNVVAVAAAPGDWSSAFGDRVHELPEVGRNTAAIPAGAVRLHAVIRRFRPDVVHVHGPSMATVAALATRRGRLVPTIVTHHGGPESDYPLGVRILRASGLPVVACGPAVAAAIVRHNGTVTATVPNGVPPAPAPAARADVDAEFGLDPRLRLVITVARLSAQKNLDRVVRVLGRLPHVQYLVLGEGEERARLEALARDLGVADRVFLPGRSARARAIVGASDAFVMTSDAEGLSLSLIEAMMSGVPVVATRVRGIAELIEHEDTGLLVTPDDDDALAAALTKVLDPQVGERLAARARQEAARYTEEAMGQAYLRLYEAAVARGAGDVRPAPVSSPAGRPHIVFVVNNYPPKVGGVEHHVSTLARHLVGLGAEVTVVALDNEHPSAVEEGVRVVRLRSTPRFAGVLAVPWLGTGRTVRRIILREGADAVSTHTRFFPMTFVGVRAARVVGVPSIHTEHGADHVAGVPAPIAWVSRLVDRTAGRYVLRRASRVLGVSTAVCAFVHRVAGVPCEVFTNGIDTSVFSPGPGSDETASHRLVYVGRVVPGKGWERVLRVAAVLATEFDDLRVDIIGEGADLPALRREASGQGLSGRVTVHGALRQEAVAGLLRGAVLVNPSTLAEGFQMTVLEAVACGAAVVSTPVPAAILLAERGAAVTLVDSGRDEDWLAATRAALSRAPHPAPDGLVADFEWRSRAVAYLDVLRDVRRTDGARRA